MRNSMKKVRLKCRSIMRELDARLIILSKEMSAEKDKKKLKKLQKKYDKTQRVKYEETVNSFIHPYIDSEHVYTYVMREDTYGMDEDIETSLDTMGYRKLFMSSDEESK